MALLQRTRILPNERLDLPDFNNIEDFVCADFKAIHKNVLTNQNFVFSGFTATGLGTNTLTIPLAGSSFVIGADDGALYIGAASLAAMQTTSLSPGVTNYIELSLTQDTGGADSRAFWDSTANSGQGAEFSQIVDTFTFEEAVLNISSSNFSGDANKVKICEVDTNGSGIITAIRDRRDLFFRLGRGTNPTFSYPWASRTEPAATLFTGADKDIKNWKNFADALMDGLREIKGTTYWFEAAPVTLGGSFRNCGLSILTQNSAGARMAWDGTKLSITDDSGSPSPSDILANLRFFDTPLNFGLSRQDGVNAISMSDGQVLWVEIPRPLSATNYASVGSTSSNYRVTNRGSVPLSDTTFWLAFRDGNNIYLRDLGELEPGEALAIDDETPEALKAFLGFNPETASSVPYTTVPDGSLLPGTFSTADTLVTAISADTQNINYLADVLATIPYEERMDIISGIPANSNQFQGPVSSMTIVPLPLDSRNGSVTHHYIVGKGQLQIWLNGIYLDNGGDWSEVGSPGSSASSIQILRALVIGDKLVFRHALAGGLFSSGSLGSQSLQNAYNGGNGIVVNTGVPFTVSGSSGKIAVFNGDITVTGVIDPAGLTFDPQSSNPLGANNGLWVDTSGNLIHSRPSLPDVNVTQTGLGNGVASALVVPMTNESGSSIFRMAPVCVDVSGNLKTVDVSQENDALSEIGVVSDTSIANNASGGVTFSGRIQDIGNTFSFRDILYIDTAGALTNTKPSIGSNGFISGDWIIRIGVVVRNINDSMKKDLLVSIIPIGQL